MIFLIWTFCGLNFSQQPGPQIIEPPPLFEFHIRERLKDGSFIVVIDGKEFRAIQADKMRQVLRDKVELDGLRAEKPLLEKRAAKAEQLADNFKADLFKAEQQRDGETARAEKLRQSYERERDLRLSAEKLKNPNTLEKILGNPIVQGAIVIVSGVVVARAAGKQ